MEIDRPWKRDVVLRWRESRGCVQIVELVCQFDRRGSAAAGATGCCGLTRSYSNSMVESGSELLAAASREVAVGCCQSLAEQCDHDAKHCSDKGE